MTRSPNLPSFAALSARLALFPAFARQFFIGALALGLVGCGGGVSPSTTVVDPARITILPDAAILYSGMPTTFVISGGNGVYILASSNQAIIPVAGNVQGSSVSLVPSPVTTDTAVTLTVRDTGSTTPVSTTVTVKPGTVNNSVSITPSATQDASCKPALCSGGDAEVAVTLSQGGIPLAVRGVRFEVVSGDFRMITTLPGVVPERLELTFDSATDERGIARARIRALPVAPNQTALIRITDLGSGAFQRTSFAIAQFTGGTSAFFTVPTSISVTGSPGNCPIGTLSDFVVFGGTPPYSISPTAAIFQVIPSVVAQSGGRFTVFGGGLCAENAPIAITDSAGRTITVTATAIRGTTPPPPLVVSPTSVALGSCTATASVVAAGGSGTYTAIASDGALTVTSAVNVFTVKRTSPSAAVTVTVNMIVTDGATFVTIPVNLNPPGVAAPAGSGICP